MKNNSKSKAIFIAGLFLGIFGWMQNSSAASPALNFSDLTSGPKSGLNDGLGQGAIVTIWGNNLGSSQGTSKVYFKDSNNQIREAAYIYYWKNADGQLPGGPSDLYAYHKMQEIAFSIPSNSADGAGKIYVEVDGVKSSELDFEVRAGHIFYVNDSGNDSVGNGSYANSWKTLDYNVGATGKVAVSAGDIIYCNGLNESGVVYIREKSGTSTDHISIVGYPGTLCKISNSSGGGIIAYWYNHINTQYWNFSKISVEATDTGIAAFTGMRVTGCEISDGTGCATGVGGAISGGNLFDEDSLHQVDGNIKIYGNYIHNYGCVETSNQHHVFYLSNRSGEKVDAYEVGWNYLKDNLAPNGINLWDESSDGIGCGDWNGTFLIHDNIVINQDSSAFDIGSNSGQGHICWSVPVYVYNNLFVNCGNTHMNSGSNYTIFMTGTYTQSHVYFFNNTIYSYNGLAGIYIDDFNFGGKYDWVNNLVIDGNNLPYYAAGIKLPDVSNNNLWYNGGDGNPANLPSWDTNPIISNPLFINPSSNNFALQSNSPAINAGSSLVSEIVNKDFLSLSRPQGSGYDIGAFEYDENTPADAVVPNAPSGLSVR